MVLFIQLTNKKLISDKRLIWNVDETSSASSKKYKVLCTKENLPLTEIDEINEHPKGLFSFNTNGDKLKPTIICQF